MVFKTTSPGMCLDYGDGMMITFFGDTYETDNPKEIERLKAYNIPGVITWTEPKARADTEAKTTKKGGKK